MLFPVDCRVAISAMCTNHADNALVSRCRGRLSDLFQRDHNVVLQWIYTRMDIHGNERADIIAKAGTDLPQPDNPVPLSSAESIVDFAAKELLNIH